MLRRNLGDRAEARVAEFLSERGYRVRHRNFLCRYGELDLVVEKDDTVCFVEVRMRSSAAWGDPAHTVSFSKQRKVVKAALHYLFQHDLQGKMIRFDVVSVIGSGPSAHLEHLPNAFDAAM